MSVQAPLDPRTAEGLLTDLGYLLVPHDARHVGDAYLLVALRAHPTLRHYDPEYVEYWATAAGRGVLALLSRDTRMPVQTGFSWGTIRIVDRLRVTNEFIVFGGELRAESLNGSRVAVLASPAPILSRAGHALGWDPGAPEAAAFFGRLAAGAGARDFERRMSGASPMARYAAFVGDFMVRHRAGESRESTSAATRRVLSLEERRLRADHPSEWREGESLRQGLIRAIAVAPPRPGS